MYFITIGEVWDILLVSEPIGTDLLGPRGKGGKKKKLCSRNFGAL